MNQSDADKIKAMFPLLPTPTVIGTNVFAHILADIAVSLSSIANEMFQERIERRKNG
jgi:hypothetical protein